MVRWGIQPRPVKCPERTKPMPQQSAAGKRHLRRFRPLLCQIALATTILASCGTETPQVPAKPLPEFQPTASVEDIMRSMIDPAADILWDAVVTTVTDGGIEKIQPETEEDWLPLELSAITLLEAGNLLLIDGRRIVGERSFLELPGNDLSSNDTVGLSGADRESWFRLSRELHDAGAELLNAVRTRSVQNLFEGGGRLYVACENCHARFSDFRDESENGPQQNGRSLP